MSEICTNCGQRPAKRYLRKVDGREIELYLCPVCYAKLYPEREENGFSLFLNSVKGEGECPSCGTSLEDFRHTGLFGCADCYRAFSLQLAPALRYIQWEEFHAGKTPSEKALENYDEMRLLAEEREQLKEEMARALKEGKYALGNAIEKRLRVLHRKLNQTEGQE